MLNIHVNELTRIHWGSNAFTSSIESLTMYRVATTSRLCPILWTRSIACSSAMGLHCGSRRWTRDAAVKSNLMTSVNVTLAKDGLKRRDGRGCKKMKYPIPADPIEASRMLHRWSVRKVSSDSLLCSSVRLPSILWNLKPFIVRATSTRSSILVHEEKMTLADSAGYR